jgi:hypothetical protein
MCPKFKPKPCYYQKKSGHVSKTILKVCPFIMNEAPTYNVKHVSNPTNKEGVRFVGLFVCFVLSCWDLPNHEAHSYVVSTLRKPLMSKAPPRWYHNQLLDIQCRVSWFYFFGLWKFNFNFHFNMISWEIWGALLVQFESPQWGQVQWDGW